SSLIPPPPRSTLFPYTTLFRSYDAAWKDIEAQGFIAPAACFEVRVDLPEAERMEYAVAEDQDRYRIASSTPEKQGLAQRIISKRSEEHTSELQSRENLVCRLLL